jgi:glc operon protein GlcG
MITETSLGYAEAKRAIDAVLDAMQSEGLAATVVVADAHGELIALARADGATLGSILIAQNKAWTAARERKTSREIGQAARHPETGFDVAYFGDRRYIGWGGGLPVMIDGKVVGAVGVSGVPEETDMRLAQIGVQAIMRGH